MPAPILSRPQKFARPETKENLIIVLESKPTSPTFAHHVFEEKKETAA